MKKQITLASLSLLTLIGGSWLAAQQRESIRTTSRSELALPAIASEPSASAVTIEPQLAEVQAPARRVTGNGRTLSRTGQGKSTDTRFDAAINMFSGGMPSQPGMPTPMAPEDAARMRDFEEAIRDLRSAESEEDKSAARELVTKLVSEQLESDLANREKELAAIELRAKELRKLLDERKSAKPEMLKMLVMLIDNPQVGLGIPQEWMQMLMRGQQSQSPYAIYPSAFASPWLQHTQPYTQPAIGGFSGYYQPNVPATPRVNAVSPAESPEPPDAPEEPSPILPNRN